MAPSKSLYPRSTVKRIIQAHSNRRMGKNTDIMVFLDYTLFMQDLMREATIESRRAGERGISAKAIRKAREKSLAKFRG